MLKPIEPNSTTTAVWEHDSALEYGPELKDADEETKGKLITQLLRNPAKWRDLFRVREGALPAVFVLGVVPSATLNRLEDQYGSKQPNQLFWGCFLAGLRDIQDGGLGIVSKVRVNDLDYVDPDWLQSKFVGRHRACGLAIGRFVYTWNNSTEDDTKNL